MFETDDFYFFYKHEFGQWTLKNITDCHGITYNCCEQYMMFQKAMLFNDRVMAESILLEKNPFGQQQLGRKVKGYHQATWDSFKYQIVWNGNWLKFTQHECLRDRILATGGKELVEASLVDKVWGIGLGLDSPDLTNKEKWVGRNLLGKSLMSVRFSLRQLDEV